MVEFQLLTSTPTLVSTKSQTRTVHLAVVPLADKGSPSTSAWISFESGGDVKLSMFWRDQVGCACVQIMPELTKLLEQSARRLCRRWQSLASSSLGLPHAPTANQVCPIRDFSKKAYHFNKQTNPRDKISILQRLTSAEAQSTGPTSFPDAITR